LQKTPFSVSSTAKNDIDDDSIVNPNNLKRLTTNQSISSAPSESPPELTASPGYRAAEAFVRPAPEAVAGRITQYGFDLRRCEFSLAIQAPAAASDDSPTVVFLPEFHFPKDSCAIEVSSGRWAISSDEDEVALVQRLRWWHGDGEQTLKVTGVVRRRNMVDGAVGEEPAEYYELWNWTWGNCSVM
jgi:hypothetical protein